MLLGVVKIRWWYTWFLEASNCIFKYLEIWWFI